MKKCLKTFLMVCLCCIFPVMLSACKEKPAHNFSTEWATDETYHWHNCLDENCTEQSDKGEHTYNSGEVVNHKMVYTCTVCGKTKESNLDHSYSSDWAKDETNHWHNCTVAGCDQKEAVSEHTFDEGTVQGHDTVFACTVCGYQKTVRNEHTFSKVWYHDDVNHWRVCTIEGCNATDSLEVHSFDKGEVDGHYKVSTCLICEAQVTEKVEHEPILDHYEYDGTNHWQICGIDNCNEIISSSVENHDYDEGTEVGHIVIYTCKTCGYTKQENRPHEYATIYSYDNYGHWYACLIDGCTSKSNYSAHNLVDGICLTCNAEVRDCVGDHSFNAFWSSDETYHWHACATPTCSAVEGKAEHQYGEGVVVGHKRVYTCECGKTKEEEIAHEFSNDWSSNELYHWHNCLIDGCTAQGSKASHNFTSAVMQNHKMVYTCSDCGRTKEELVPHKYSEVWESDDNFHWHTCTIEGCTETSEKTLHNWSDAEVVDHKNHVVCVACGKVSETVLEHDFSGEYKFDEINHWHTCTVKGCTEVDGLNAHSFTEEIIVDHKLVKTCTVCGYRYEKLLEHNFAEDWASDDDNHWHICTVEGCTEVSALSAHEFDDGKVVDHKLVKTCTVCGKTKEEVLEHNFEGEFIFDQNYHWHSCTVEGCDQNSGKQRHNLLIDTKGEEEITYVCSICNNTIVLPNDKYIRALESIATENYGVKLSNIKVKTTVYVDVDFVELYLSKDEKGNLYGYGSGTLSEPTQKNLLKNITVLIQDGYLYYYSESRDRTPDRRYGKAPLDSIVQGMLIQITGQASIDFNDILEVIDQNKEQITQIINEITNFVSNLYLDNRIKANEVIKFIVQNFFTATAENGTIKYSFNFDKLDEINTYLNTQTVKDIFESEFGTDTYTFTKAFLMTVPGLTVEQVVTLLKKKGIDIYQILDDADAKIAEVYAKIYEIVGEEPSEDPPTLETLINLVLSMTATEIRVPDDLKEFLTSLNDKTITDIVNMIAKPEKPITSEMIQNMISSTMDKYGKMTVYEIIEEIMSKPSEVTTFANEETSKIYNMVSGIITMLRNTVAINFETNGDGLILTSSISFDFNSVVGKFELVKDYTLQGDVQKIKNEMDPIINSVEITETSLPATIDGYTRTRTPNEDGTVTVTFVQESTYLNNSNKFVYEFNFDKDGKLATISHLYESSNQTDQQVDHIFNKINFDLNSTVVSLELDCNGWICIMISDLNGVYEGYTSIDGVVTNSYYIATFDLYYNLKTKDVLISDYANMAEIEHLFDEADTEYIETEYGYLVVHKCKNCGEKYYTEVFTNIDVNLSNEFDNLVNQANNGKPKDDPAIEKTDVIIKLENTKLGYIYSEENSAWVLVDATNYNDLTEGYYEYRDYSQLFSKNYCLWYLA